MKDKFGVNYEHIDGLDELPMCNKYFYNFSIDNILRSAETDANISSIVAATSNISIKQMELCKNTVEIKDDHMIREGHLLKLTLDVGVQIKYVGGHDNMSIFVESMNFIKLVYITIPEYMDEPYGATAEKIPDLYRKNKLYGQVYVEDVQVIEFDKASIKFSLLALTVIFFKALDNVTE